MSDYIDFLKEKKRENNTLSSISTLQRNYDELFKENFNLKQDIKSLKDIIKKNKDINDMRFGEVYAFLAKVEKTYYNGLFNDTETSPNEASTNDINETQKNQNLFGNMGILKNNESLFIHTNENDLETMKKILM